MNTTFFDYSHYIIDEKVNLLKFENCYKVFNKEGAEIGTVNQKLTAFQKVLRLLINKQNLPFLLEIRDKKGALQSSLSRGWTLFMSKLTIQDATGQNIGFIKQKFKLLKPEFKIYDTAENLLATIKGDWKAWEFSINNDKSELGSISKAWNGALKEVFTTADKYHVYLKNSNLTLHQKIAILSAAITVDMILKEKK